jgi:hypothetical protein
MRHKTSKSLYAYWNALRGGRMAPRRFEIEPVNLGEALPDTFILERQDQTTFPYRLAGTRLCERFRKEFRGHDFLAGWSAADSLTLRNRLNSISMHGGVSLVLAQAQSAGGKTLHVEVLILPLIHGQDIADRFLGVLSPIEAPAWLGFDPLCAMHILEEETIWPDGPPGTDVAMTDDDRQTPFLPQVRHARIVRSNRRQFRVFDGGLSRAAQDPPLES